MARKKWVKQEAETESLALIRAKRKWQIALRRYVLEGQKSLYYAPYFGLDINTFRKWMELQFDQDMNWDNFSSVWQFDHIIPVAYFDFEDEADLQLCWSFINLRPGKLDQNKNRTAQVDVLTAKAYFKKLSERTGYSICKKMVEKIERIELAQLVGTDFILAFLQENKQMFETMATFNADDFDRLNTGTPYAELAFEKEFLKKFA